MKYSELMKQAVKSRRASMIGQHRLVRMDDDEVQWISTKSGAHIPLVDGKAVGGAGGSLKGKDFSKAKSRVNIPDKCIERKKEGYSLNKERNTFIREKGLSGDEDTKLIDIIGDHTFGNTDSAAQQMVDFVHEHSDVLQAASDFELAVAEKLYGKPAEEIMVYRKGGYDDPVLSFTTNKDGAILYEGTEHEMQLFPDHKESLANLIKQGIVPVAGYGVSTNQNPSEEEVTFVNLQAAKNKPHSNRKPYNLPSSEREEVEKQAKKIGDKYEKFNQACMEEDLELNNRLTSGKCSIDEFVKIKKAQQAEREAIEAELDYLADKHKVELSMVGLSHYKSVPESCKWTD